MTAVIARPPNERRCIATTSPCRGTEQLYAAGWRCQEHKPRYIGPFGFPRRARAA